MLEQCEKCIANNVSFSPVVQIQKGRPTIIKKGSYEEAIIADWMQQGLRFQIITLMVNQHWLECDLKPVGLNCIMNSFYRMQPLVTKIKKMPQGHIQHELGVRKKCYAYIACHWC